MNKLIYFIILVILSVLLLGCNIGNNNDAPDNGNKSDNFDSRDAGDGGDQNDPQPIILDNDGSFDEYVDDGGVEFNMANITDDAVLVLDVTYSGGCVDHGFTMVWDGNVMESYPPQINLFLFHDFNDDPCDGLVDEKLYFDFDFDAPIIAHIRNGESYADEDTITVEFSD
jgi:hypothetical protein